MTAPLSLIIGHAPIASEAELAKMTAADLHGRLQSPTRLPLPSGQDVLALLAKAIPYDLVLVETALVDDYPNYVSNALVGTTVLIEANILLAHTLEILQEMVGNQQQQLISDLVKLGREQKVLVSRRELTETINGRYYPKPNTPPNPILEAAALLHLMHQTAETAVAQQHSLILRYEEPNSAPVPTRKWPAWIRLLIAADLFALTFLAIAAFRQELWERDGRILHWHEPLLSYILLTSGFLLPPALAHLYTRWQTRRDGPPPSIRRFHATFFLLCLACIAALLPQMPLTPWLAQFLVATFISSLAFTLEIVGK